MNKIMEADPFIEAIIEPAGLWMNPADRVSARRTLYIIKEKRVLHSEDLIQLTEVIPVTFGVLSDLFGMTPKMLRDAVRSQHIWRDDVFERLLEGLKRMYK